MNKSEKDKKEISPYATEALERFAIGPGIAERSAAITDLLAQKALARVTKEGAFRLGLAGLQASLSQSSVPETRLAVLAQLVRIAQSVKPLSNEIRKLVIPFLVQELPPVGILKEADDRGYVARACSWSKEAWVSAYAFRAIAEEETGEKARAEFIAIVFARSQSLAEIFARLAKAVSELRPETEAPAESIARRVIRIVTAVRAATVNSLLPPGQDVGEAYGTLVRQPFSAVGLPEREESCLALSREIVLGVHDLVRTRFAVATDVGTYTAIKFCKRLFGGSSWPSELRSNLELVAGSILEAVLLLAKQGIPSAPLVEHLELVVGHRERADVLLRELADLHPEIPEQVRAWLRKQRLPNAAAGTDAIAESRELRMDPTVGQVLLDLQRIAESRELMRSNVIPALQLYDPSQVASLEVFLTRVDMTVRGIEEIAKQRRLGLLGSPGDEIDYTPKYFETTHDTPGQRVRVVRPAIVRLLNDGSPGEVVVRGLVE